MEGREKGGVSEVDCAPDTDLMRLAYVQESTSCLMLQIDVKVSLMGGLDVESIMVCKGSSDVQYNWKV